MAKNNKQELLRHISIDCAVFGYHEKQFKILLLKFINSDIWCLPGGFVTYNEDIDEAAKGILKKRTGLIDIFLEQSKVFGKNDRTSNTLLKDILSPKIINEYEENWFSDRFISIAYTALVDYSMVNPVLDELCDAYQWFDLQNLPDLIFDHKEIIETTLSLLQHNLDAKLINSDLLPESFTMKDLQNIYEAILGKPLRRNNFQRKMLNLDILERLDKLYTGAQHKAPYLYKFKN